MCDTQTFNVGVGVGVEVEVEVIKPKKVKKTCTCCKKKLSLVDKTLDKCKGCNKRFCLSCLKPEMHACANKTKDHVVAYKPIIPRKVDHI